MNKQRQTDPIIEEFREIRRKHAESLDYDIDRIIADFQRKEREAGRQSITRPPRPVQSVRRARST
jgi:hypothetical protein